MSNLGQVRTKKTHTHTLTNCSCNRDFNTLFSVLSVDAERFVKDVIEVPGNHTDLEKHSDLSKEHLISPKQKPDGGDCIFCHVTPVNILLHIDFMSI